MLKVRKWSQSKYGNKWPPAERRICIKSQPVKCIEHVPQGKKAQYHDNPYKNNHNYPFMTKLNSKSGMPSYPDIYIDMERNENCVTTVRHTSSKIKWPQFTKKSRYHKKCVTLIDQKIPKAKKIKKKTIASDTDCSLTNFDKEKYQNDCYCRLIDGETKSRSESRIPMKPIIITEERKKSYVDNDEVKDICKNLDYDPQSEFLNRLKKGMKKAFDCKCSTCMLEKLEKSLKYTNRRALIEGAYSERTVPTPTEKKVYKSEPKTKCHCKIPICICSVNNTKIIREKNFFDTHSTEDLKTDYPPHKCVHKFGLDERLIPKPLKEDSYGQSRCELCNKTIRKGVNNISSSVSKKFSDKDVQMPSKWNMSEKTLTSSNDLGSNLFMKSSEPNIKNCIKTNYLKSSKTRITFTDEKTTPNSDNSNYKTYLGKCLCGMSKSNYLQNCNCVTNKVTAPNKAFPRLSSGCTKVNYNNYDTILELDLQNLDDDQLNSNKFFEKCKKINIKPNVSPYNSLALRFQRGVF